jgi:hypothetical protein
MADKVVNISDSCSELFSNRWRNFAGHDRSAGQFGCSHIDVTEKIDIEYTNITRGTVPDLVQSSDAELLAFCKDPLDAVFLSED